MIKPNHPPNRSCFKSNVTSIKKKQNISSCFATRMTSKSRNRMHKYGRFNKVSLDIVVDLYMHVSLILENVRMCVYVYHKKNNLNLPPYENSDFFLLIHIRLILGAHNSSSKKSLFMCTVRFVYKYGNCVYDTHFIILR